MLSVAWSHLDLSDLGKIIQEQLLSEDSAIHKGTETAETAIFDHVMNQGSLPKVHVPPRAWLPAAKLSKFCSRDKLHIQAWTSESNYLNPVQFAFSLSHMHTHFYFIIHFDFILFVQNLNFDLTHLNLERYGSLIYKGLSIKNFYVALNNYFYL